MRKFWHCSGVALLMMAVPTTHAEGWTFGAHLKYQYANTDYRARDVAAVVGEDPASDHLVDARAKAEWRGHGFDFAAHYEVLSATGDSVETRRRLAARGFRTTGSVSGLPDDGHRLFDLTDDFIDEPRAVAVHRMDRLAIGYGTGNLTVRLGRQAVSWGNGLAFQVLDFVNPFSPIAIDKDYKTGEDMLYGQWLWAGGSDLQAILLPRRDPATHELDRERHSYAMKWRGRAGGFEIDALLARHVDQSLVGGGLVRSVGGAVWRLDALHTDVPHRDGVWSLVSNVDWSWVLFGRNMYGFAEYLRNGFGASRDTDYLAIDPELTARLLRGELFTVGRDNAAIGIQVEVAPLLNLFGTVIQNLNDGSRLVQVRGTWDIRQDLTFMGGVTLPSGDRNTEYGGLPGPIPGTWLGPGRTLFARVAYYL